MIPYGRQEITDADVDAVVAVLRSDFLTQGPVVPRFEEAVATYCGAGHGVAANSATSALHLACLALGLGPDDWLWTSPITFVASANCGLYCGAKVDFVDIDPRSFNMCPNALEQKLIKAQRDGKLPKIVVPVHLCGQPCDMAAIRELSEKFGFLIIEDASHAIGAKYQGDPVGNCRYSDVTVFSFHPVKIITTAEGGLALTNDGRVAEKMALLRSHGITRNPVLMTEPSHGGWYYQQLELGFNYRMTELQAALGLSQLSRLDEYVMRRHQLAQHYDSEFQSLPMTVQYRELSSYSAFHLYVIRLERSIAESSHKNVFEHLRQLGIGVNLHYIPVHMQPYYQKFGFSRGDFPEAEAYYQQAISLPLFPTLPSTQQQQVVEMLKKVLGQ
jgi:UDP-4-amino-4,6-dideoxy-N-acetyl-beta-L-altrosamine transaminase